MDFFLYAVAAIIAAAAIKILIFPSAMPPEVAHDRALIKPGCDPSGH
jgi:acid phosphatase family membrane protein YuiD